jgi:hypothetical protein
MNTQMVRPTIIAAIALATWLVTGPQVLAQGTATGPVTAHDISGPPYEVFIGDLGAPIPIDLDPNGPPWTKEIFVPVGVTVPPGSILTVHETIINVGTEDWWDWHEHIAPDPFGSVPGLWNDPPKLMVDGNPITFDFMGTGTPDLWMDNFSDPVRPGDILEVWKDIRLLQLGSDPTVPALVIHEYPTPEPASMALLGAGGLFLLVRRRRRDG